MRVYGSSFSYGKITFNFENDTDITVKCRSYGESGYDYGLISKLDIELAKSETDDGATGSTKVLHNFKGESKPDWVDISFGLFQNKPLYFINFWKFF